MEPVSLEEVARLRFSLVRLARRIRQRSGTQLTPSRLSAMETIERHGSLRVGELTAKERVGKASMTRTVAHLEEEGYLTRTQDPDDGRSHRVALTHRGRRVLENWNLNADAYLALQVAGLPENDQQVLAAAIPVLQHLLEVKAEEPTIEEEAASPMVRA